MEITEYDELGKERIIVLNDEDLSPVNNPNAIVLLKRKDGNWRGFTQKHGKIIESREGKPEDALLMLLTHE
jgi:hypothetical protein